MNWIELKTNEGKPVWVNLDQISRMIENTGPQSGNSMLFSATLKPNGEPYAFPVMETPQEILEKVSRKGLL